jgi:hypothetical protein
MEQLKFYEMENERGTEINIQTRNESFRKMGTFGNFHNIVIYTRNSPGRTNDFLTLAKRRIPMDNRTKWNNWYQIIQTAIELESAIDFYSKRHSKSLSNDFLNFYNWNSLRTICSFLEIFERVILII